MTQPAKCPAIVIPRGRRSPPPVDRATGHDWPGGGVGAAGMFRRGVRHPRGEQPGHLLLSAPSRAALVLPGMGQRHACRCYRRHVRSASDHPLVGAAVKLQVLAGDVAGLGAAQEGTGCPELLAGRGAWRRCCSQWRQSPRQTRCPAAWHPSGHEPCAVGVKPPREEIVDRHVVDRGIGETAFDIAVSPERAAVDSPIIGNGAFTIAEVLPMMRPNFWARIDGGPAGLGLGRSLFPTPRSTLGGPNPRWTPGAVRHCS